MTSNVKMVRLLGCLLLVGCATSKPDPSAVKQQISADIQPHSTQTQVLDYLNKQKIDHSQYHRDEEKGNVIDAAYFVKSKGMLVNPTYSVQFHFDTQDRLVDYDVQWLGYVPL